MSVFQQFSFGYISSKQRKLLRLLFLLYSKRTLRFVAIVIYVIQQILDMFMAALSVSSACRHLLQIFHIAAGK
jgi:hypothetical protein